MATPHPLAEPTAPSGADPARLERIDPRVCLPLLGVHVGCLGVLWTGVSCVAVAVGAALFAARAFGLTAGYHRGLAHRSFRTSRSFQFLLAFLGASAAQLGPLWWPAHHRVHHLHADTPRDVHPPGVKGLWWAHMGWLLCRRHSATRLDMVPDLARYPELRFLDRYHWIAPASLAAALYGLGAVLGARVPQLGTSGPQLLVWGFFVSTVLLYHVTFAVNSLGHSFGSRRFETRDASRNNLLLALITLGDGWHNNHHHYPASARHGFGWWEVDPTYWLLRGLARLGLVRGLREPPVELLGARRRPATIATKTLARQVKANKSPTRP
jgi:stearoyl-CoA desaturase (delta-9 desaturase)